MYIELPKNSYFKRLKESKFSLYFEYYWLISMFQLYKIYSWFKPSITPVKDQYEVFIDEKIKI